MTAPTPIEMNCPVVPSAAVVIVPLEVGTPRGALIDSTTAPPREYCGTPSHVVYMAAQGGSGVQELYRVPLDGSLPAARIHPPLSVDAIVGTDFRIAVDNSVLYVADQEQDGVRELFVTSFGVLFAIGIVCILFGGSMVFDMPEVSDLDVSFWPVLVPVVAGFGIVAGAVVLIVTRSMFRAQTAGVDDLLGLVGESRTALDAEGRVFVRGEYWIARADQAIPEGERVEVTGVEGMLLRVRRARSIS